MSGRIIRCIDCEIKIDRDLYAAINLLSTVSFAGFQACGEEDASLKALSETSLSEAGTKPCTDLYTF